jgi:rRNA-processing protein FCF1
LTILRKQSWPNASRNAQSQQPISYLTASSYMKECFITQVIVREVEPLVEKHADKIAEAVVLLEPMLKEMKELNSLKTIENQDTFLTEDEVVKQAVKNIKEFAAEVKAYSKEV